MITKKARKLSAFAAISVASEPMQWNATWQDR